MSDNNYKNIIGMEGLLGWFLAGIIGILLSSVFVLIYNYSGTHVINPSGATDYKWISKQYKANATEGINFMQMDENGFNNLFSNTDEIDMLLMGGSHMEAIQIDTGLNAGSLLNEMLPGMKVYNIGMSGHQILNCLDNLEAALEEYHPSKYVVVQTGNLDFGVKDLKAVVDGTFSEIPSYDSGLLYYLQKIPSLKVIYKQLSDKVSIDRKSENIENVEAAQHEQVSKETLFASVLAEKELICEEYGVQLVIAYTPSISITENGDMIRTDDLGWIKKVETYCESKDIIWIDCFDSFAEQYGENFDIPFGFHNTTMESGHLNTTGHRLLAEEITKELKENSK